MPLGGGARAVLPVRCHTRDVGIVVVPLCLRHRWASVNRGRFTYVRPNRGPLQRMSDSSATFSSRWGISISGKIVSSDCPSVGVCHEKSVSMISQRREFWQAVVDCVREAKVNCLRFEDQVRVSYKVRRAKISYELLNGFWTKYHVYIIQDHG